MPKRERLVRKEQLPTSQVIFSGCQPSRQRAVVGFLTAPKGHPAADIPFTQVHHKLGGERNHSPGCFKESCSREAFKTLSKAH